MGGSHPHSLNFLRRLQVHQNLRQLGDELGKGAFQGNYGDGAELLRNEGQMHYPGSEIGLHQIQRHLKLHGSTLPTKYFSTSCEVGAQTE